MKWIDYRERLGIGFNDKNKFEMLKNKICNMVYNLLDQYTYSKEDYFNYCITIGEPIENYTKTTYCLWRSFDNTTNVKELISKYVALFNSLKISNFYNRNTNTINFLYRFIKESLNSLNIQYELMEDGDEIFIFPKGADELDESLVSEPLQWLSSYPNSRTAFIKALKDYSSSKSDNASVVADSFRKALERFFQEFFSNGRTLENSISDYCNFLKNHNVPKEIANNFNSLLNCYKDFNNNYAKHHDKTSTNVLEYIMYETGNIIRLLITLNNS